LIVINNLQNILLIILLKVTIFSPFDNYYSIALFDHYKHIFYFLYSVFDSGMVLHVIVFGNYIKKKPSPTSLRERATLKILLCYKSNISKIGFNFDSTKYIFCSQSYFIKKENALAEGSAIQHRIVLLWQGRPTID
jgi:hypothetical protein